MLGLEEESHGVTGVAVGAGKRRCGMAGRRARAAGRPPMNLGVEKTARVLGLGVFGGLVRRGRGAVHQSNLGPS